VSIVIVIVIVEAKRECLNSIDGVFPSDFFLLITKMMEYPTQQATVCGGTKPIHSFYHNSKIATLMAIENIYAYLGICDTLEAKAHLLGANWLE
jgi:hypothetical protein